MEAGDFGAHHFFLYEVFYGWFYSYRYYAIAQVGHLRSDRLQLELQYESLKSQISPHYLFNCLNTISALLYKDSQMAEEFIRRMADTFRYVLTNQRQKARHAPRRNRVREGVLLPFTGSLRTSPETGNQHPEKSSRHPHPYPFVSSCSLKMRSSTTGFQRTSPCSCTSPRSTTPTFQSPTLKQKPFSPGQVFVSGSRTSGTAINSSQEKKSVKNDERFTVQLPVVKATVRGANLPA